MVIILEYTYNEAHKAFGKLLCALYHTHPQSRVVIILESLPRSDIKLLTLV
jgi:hypothetical protein